MPDPNLVAESNEPAATLPARIGPYRILGILGEGASGRVYLAEETEPSREIALKVLRTASLPAEARLRFRREAELLARLEHPAIARLYAAGVADTEAGPLPWLAMERVQGHDLLTWANAQPAPSIDAKLALLAEIGRAVHYAHSRGIVHRDLKPANILVDANGQPHVLDFGVAHMTREDAAMTMDGQVLGTVPYMSTEQLAGSRAADDPRSDVYALGVIAYQLLSGVLPYPGLSTSTVMEAIAVLRDARAERLSLHLPQARGDTETVVMKAMAAEATQRYGTAAELAEELDRVRQRQPIIARAPTAGYLLRLFVRRHRALSAAIAVAALALVIGSVVSIRYGMLEARARAEADTRAAQLDASNAFLENILAGSDPEVLRGHPPSLREFLDAARVSLDNDHSVPMPVRALVARTMGLTFARSGDVEQGLALIASAQAALDATPGTDTYTRNRLRLAHAEVFSAAGRYAGALQLLQPLLAEPQPRDKLGQRLWLEARSQAVTDTATLGQTQQAISAITPLRADSERLLGLDDKLSLAIASQAIQLRHQSGDGKGALADYEALLPVLQKTLGPYHPDTFTARLAQAAIVRELGDLPRSEALTRALMADLDRTLGPRHMLTITTHFMLAAALQSQDPASTEAVALMRGVLAQYRAQLGPDHHYTLSAMSALAVFLQKQNRYEEAAALSRQALESAQRQGFADGPETLSHENAYALSLMHLGRLKEACTRFDALVPRARKALGEAHLQTITFTANAGECLLRAHEPARALALLEPDYQLAVKHLGPAHPQTALTSQRLADAYRTLGMQAKAGALLRADLK
ncbi:serine/threonine-protein kinase [Thermomonas sp. HDW16]|uniref:serine/threonine-protein kinase n=1 Tax=Thermomonas sp. HDW16 TaxID=2714945 RepID=UPI0014090DEF|nr:serine/threonine-protein kinase [Thermomonas sp. HDW16]QIL21112.1 serine/threonine protein kinase [Thermomonas sp. HDW16]